MSSWWQTSDGEDLRQTDPQKDLPTGGGFDPIPDKTKVLAIVDSAGIGEKDGKRYAEATLTIIKPEGYANRKLFPRFWIFDENPHASDPKKKRDNDMRRFVKLDAACGGKLAKVGREPDADDISLAFTNKQVIVQVMLMTPKEEGKEPFNWYADYWRRGDKEISEGPKPKPQERREPEYADNLDDSEVPF